MELVVLKLQEGPTFGDVILSRSSDWKDSPQDIMLKAVTREVYRRQLSILLPTALNALNAFNAIILQIRLKVSSRFPKMFFWNYWEF